MLEEHLLILSEIFRTSSPLYVVGGYIRDKLLNKSATDVDLCSALSLKEVEELLINTPYNLKIKNKSFGTAIIYNKEINFEYSVFRKEIYSQNKQGKHSPKIVEFVKDINIDAMRRDFTINSIYYNLDTGETIDIFNGKNDIKNQTLKMVTPTTLDYDGERILRLARFMTELNFNIDDVTYKSAKNNAKNVLLLSEASILKFTNSIKHYSTSKKNKIKNFLKSLNLDTISKQI